MIHTLYICGCIETIDTAAVVTSWSYRCSPHTPFSDMLNPEDGGRQIRLIQTAGPTPSRESAVFTFDTESPKGADPETMPFREAALTDIRRAVEMCYPDRADRILRMLELVNTKAIIEEVTVLRKLHERQQARIRTLEMEKIGNHRR